MNTQAWPGARTDFILLALLFSFLAGCSAGQKVKTEIMEPEPPAVAEPSPQPEGPSVVRFEDGREGFIISEVPKMEEELRRDFERALAVLEDGDYEEAIEILEKIVDHSPGVTAPYINLAIACRRLDRFEKAEESLKTALDIFPDHPVASNEYGLLLRRDGRFAEARTVYEKSLASFPEYLPMHKNLGILCDLYLNDPACAREHYELYSKAMPEDERVKIWIAELRMRLGLPQED